MASRLRNRDEGVFDFMRNLISEDVSSDSDSDLSIEEESDSDVESPDDEDSRSITDRDLDNLTPNHRRDGIWTDDLEGLGGMLLPSHLH